MLPKTYAMNRERFEDAPRKRAYAERYSRCGSGTQYTGFDELFELSVPLLGKKMRKLIVLIDALGDGAGDDNSDTGISTSTVPTS
jgi:hypothetical protein